MSAASSFDQTFAGWSGPNAGRQHQQDSQESCRVLQRTVSVVAGPAAHPAQYQGPYRRLLDEPAAERSYLLHVPCDVPLQLAGDDAVTDRHHLRPAVVLLHGSDETMFDSELLQGDCSWWQLSDDEGFVLIVAQARAMLATARHDSWRPPDDPLRSLWLCGFVDARCSDHAYLEAVLADALTLCPDIDLARIFVVGFSNGGFFAADLALGSCHPPLCATPQLAFQVAAVCCVMGGLDTMQITDALGLKQLLQLDHALDHSAWTRALPLGGQSFGPSRSLCHDRARATGPDVLLITGDLDCQIFSVHDAWMSLSSRGFYAELDVLHDTDHRYPVACNPRIWQFFQHSPHTY